MVGKIGIGGCGKNGSRICRRWLVLDERLARDLSENTEKSVMFCLCSLCNTEVTTVWMPRTSERCHLYDWEIQQATDLAR